MKAMAARDPQPLFAPPISSPDGLSAALAVAHRRRRDVIDGFSTERVVAGLAGAAADWLRPDEPFRRFAIDEVARASGLHRDMVATGIDFIFSAVTVEGLDRLAQAVEPTGPGVVFYSLAGNVPGQGVAAIARSLLARSIAIVRDSERQPVITAAFRATLGRYEPTLAALVLPVAWSHRRGDRSLEGAAVEAADRVELYGADPTVSDLADRYQQRGSTDCELHGARVSAGLVLPGAELAAAARDFAVDVTMYEGRGCLTPHVILVEGNDARTSAFSDALARALAARETRWPRARGDVTEESERRRFIDEAEMYALSATSERPAGDRCLVGASSAWCVRQTSDASVRLGPGFRCVRVAAVAERSAAIAALRTATPRLAGVGVAGANARSGQSGIDDAALDTLLRSAGATLVCPAGRMQAPPIDWRPEGQSLRSEQGRTESR